MSYKGATQRNAKLKKLADETYRSYGAGAYFDNTKGRFIRYSVHNAWLKTHCRRMTRRRMKRISNDVYPINQKRAYKKYYDYWWELL